MSVRDLRGKRCLITGAASGIGRSTAHAAAARGADLYLTDIDAEGLSKVGDEVSAAGGDGRATRRPRTSPTTRRSSAWRRMSTRPPAAAWTW